MMLMKTGASFEAPVAPLAVWRFKASYGRDLLYVEHRFFASLRMTNVFVILGRSYSRPVALSLSSCGALYCHPEPSGEGSITAGGAFSAF